MSKPPRPTAARTTRKPPTRSRLGLPEKPDAASRRLRTRREPAEETPSTASVSPTSPTTEIPARHPVPAEEPTVPSAPSTDAPHAKPGRLRRTAATAPVATPPEPAASSSPSVTPSEATADAAPAARADVAGSPPRRNPADVAPKRARGRKARGAPASPAPTARARKTAVAPPPPDKPAPAEVPAVAARASESAMFAAAPTGGLGIAGALGEELAAFSRRLIEDSSERARELATARSLTDLIEIQARQLRAVSDAWLQHAARMRAIYLDALQNAPDDDRR